MAVDRLKSRPWHIQINARLGIVSDIIDVARTSPMPLVFDHFDGAGGRAYHSSSPCRRIPKKR